MARSMRGHRVAIGAEKTRQRLLETFERARVVGRRDQSSGIGQCGHGSEEAVIGYCGYCLCHDSVAMIETPAFLSRRPRVAAIAAIVRTGLASKKAGRRVIRALDHDRRLHPQSFGLAERLKLPLAGIDLRRTPEGRHVCFEVNPSPAFSFYERRAGLPIASSIARYLAGEVH